MSELKNDNAHIELRKQQKVLSVSGLAMIAFSIWSITKFFAKTFFEHRFREIFIEANDGKPLTTELLIAAFVIFCILMGFVLGMHWIVGYGAYKKGKGRKAGAGYIITDILIGVLTAYSIYNNFLNYEPSRLITEIIPDISMLIISTIILVSSWKIGKLQKELVAEKGGMK